jgi:hypothetical protein
VLPQLILQVNLLLAPMQMWLLLVAGILLDVGKRQKTLPMGAQSGQDILPPSNVVHVIAYQSEVEVPSQGLSMSRRPYMTRSKTLLGKQNPLSLPATPTSMDNSAGRRPGRSRLGIVGQPLGPSCS